jgi:hypothetical protein
MTDPIVRLRQRLKDEVCEIRWINHRLASLERHVQALSLPVIEAPIEAVPPSSDEVKACIGAYVMAYVGRYTEHDEDDAMDNLNTLAFAIAGVDSVYLVPTDRSATLVVTMRAEIAAMETVAAKKRAASAARTTWLNSNPIAVVEAPPNAAPLSLEEVKDILRQFMMYYGESGTNRLIELCMAVAGVGRFSDVPTELYATLALSAQGDLHTRRSSGDYRHAVEHARGCDGSSDESASPA